MGMRYRRSRGGRKKMSGGADIGYLLIALPCVLFPPLGIYLALRYLRPDWFTEYRSE